MNFDVHVIGAGLAGSEAALIIAANGLTVRLSEMRPERTTPVHQTGYAAELVCSNSLGSMKMSTSGGCLKRECAILGSPLLKIALQHRVPAGHAMAVDRELFAQSVTNLILHSSNIELVREEITEIDASNISVPTIIASGPLTSEPLLQSIENLLGEKNLFFFDAISPSIADETIDFSKVFYGSRYETDSPDYLNCPMTRIEYENFYNELVKAERIEIKDFEPDKLFQGCQPIESVAQSGLDSLRFGALKPVGLVDPRTGKRPWAVVQLRREQVDTSSWNMVGFQTRLKHNEQKRIFRMIPGLEKAEFVRLGSMHRNAYINAPYILEPTLQISEFPNILIAGCLAGVEGYMEDIATGYLAGITATALVKKLPVMLPPSDTMHGALVRAITNPRNVPFQPTAATLGLLPPLDQKINPKNERRATLVKRSLDSMSGFVESLKENGFIIPDRLVFPE